MYNKVNIVKFSEKFCFPVFKGDNYWHKPNVKYSPETNGNDIIPVCHHGISLR